MKGLFLTFEGTEGSGKSTQVTILAEKLKTLGYIVRTIREPGGTPIGEEIRHTLKHSNANHGMMSETELLLMNASRAQLVREIIRPALAAGEIVISDRFYDSTVAYQGYGRGLDREFIRELVSFAVGDTRPDLTLLLLVPVAVSEARRLARQPMLFKIPATPEEKTLPTPLPLRDRMEEADRSFFERVEEGYKAIGSSEPKRIKVIEATSSVESISQTVWAAVMPKLAGLEK